MMHPERGTYAAPKGDGRTRQTRPAEPGGREVIDLSAPSWEVEDTSVDSMEEGEAAIISVNSRNIRKTTSSTNRSTSTRSGSRLDNDASAQGGAVSKKGTERDRPAAPLTSISALFGGGGEGNRAVSTSKSTSTSRAGTKRPRAPATVTHGRVRSPMPPPLPPLSAPTADAFGVEASRRRRHAPGASLGGVSGSLSRGSGAGGAVEDKLWPDKHRPRDLSGLAVHAKKVDEVRHWMETALAARPDSGAYRLLALVGPPGCAKSTMVRLLAQDMGVELAEWQDTSGQGGPVFRPLADGPALAGVRPRYDLGGGSGGGSGYQSSLDSFEEFLKRSSSYRALSMISVKSTRLRKDELLDGTGTAAAAAATIIAGSSRSSSVGNRWVDGDEDYDDKYTKSGGRGRAGVRRCVVLIEELPSTFGEGKRERLKRLVAECARSSPCPVVIIWSQASESSSYQSELEQVLSRETLRLPGVQVTTCNPINATLLRQHLRGVLALEGVSDPRGALVESAVTTCSGDIRHALLSLQMAALGTCGGGSSVVSAKALDNGYGSIGRGAGQRRTKRGSSSSSSSSSRSCRAINGVSKKVAAAGATGTTGPGTRDTFLTQFHALGKLLHAKRLPADGSDDGGTGMEMEGVSGEGERKGRLTFIPEEVLSQGGMDLDWALAFLQCHCVDFFTDEEDVSAALGYFSDADMFASRAFQSSRGASGGGVVEQAVFPHRYAESIASRATAVSNKHPAKNRMRSFSAPKSFDVRRRRTEAAGALRRFVGDAWDASGGDLNALWASTRHLKETVDTELLPAARLITGEWEAEAALRALLHRFMEDRRGRRDLEVLGQPPGLGQGHGHILLPNHSGNIATMSTASASSLSLPRAPDAKGLGVRQDDSIEDIEEDEVDDEEL